MDFAERIQKLARSVKRRRNQVRTEEATKTSLVMPFIAALGYDIHEPEEVVPEFTADAGVKQQEKVDYAIVKDGKPIILVECKSAGISLGKGHLSQLIRYYAVTDARFGILTNGVEYRFYTDLRKRNVMDESPFLVVSMPELEAWQVAEIGRFAKPVFDEQAIWDLVNTSEVEQKDLKTITENIAREFATPSRDLVKVLAKGILGKGVQRKAERERVTNLTKRALDQYTGASVAAESDSENGVSPAKSEEEARKEQQSDAGRKAAETRRQHQATQQLSEEPDFGYYRYWKQLKANPELYSLFVALREYASSLGNDVQVNPTKYYISFRRNRTAAYVKSQTGKVRLIVYVYADLEVTAMHKGFTRKLPESFRNPPCNLEITIRNHDDLERAKPLIQRSYEEAG